MTAVEGNASVYQVNPVSRITGEGRAECLRTWGPSFDQKGAGVRGETVGAAHFVCGNYKSYTSQGDKYIPGTEVYTRCIPGFHFSPL